MIRVLSLPCEMLAVPGWSRYALLLYKKTLFFFSFDLRLANQTNKYWLHIDTYADKTSTNKHLLHVSIVSGHTNKVWLHVNTESTHLRKSLDCAWEHGMSVKVSLPWFQNGHQRLFIQPNPEPEVCFKPLWLRSKLLTPPSRFSRPRTVPAWAFEVGLKTPTNKQTNLRGCTFFILLSWNENKDD